MEQRQKKLFIFALTRKNKLLGPYGPPLDHLSVNPDTLRDLQPWIPHLGSPTHLFTLSCIIFISSSCISNLCSKSSGKYVSVGSVYGLDVDGFGWVNSSALPPVAEKKLQMKSTNNCSIFIHFLNLH